MTTSPYRPFAAERRLNIGLWVLQVLLSLFALSAGYNHGIRPLDEAVLSATWISAVSPALVRFIGFAELAAAAGLVFPLATGVLPWLTPMAAAGLALLMALAIPFHVMRGEANVIGLHIVVGSLAAFVAWRRYKEL
jgi:putative oxidoreductase